MPLPDNCGVDYYRGCPLHLGKKTTRPEGGKAGFLTVDYGLSHFLSIIGHRTPFIVGYLSLGPQSTLHRRFVLSAHVDFTIIVIIQL